LSFVCYGNSLRNAFISDDVPAIVNNPDIPRTLGYWNDPHSFLNSLSYRLAGLNPFSYHCASILLHSFNTILVFFFLSLFFSTAASFWGAMIFVVHPVHTEAVTWISGRPYLFVALFVISIYLLYSRATSFPSGSVKSRAVSYGLALMFFTYFLISQFTFFALTPLLLVFSDITFKKGRKNFKYWIPFFVLVAIRIIWGHQAVLDRVNYLRQEMHAASLLQNPLFYFVYSFFTHLGLLVFPLRLTLLHEPSPAYDILFKHASFFSILIFGILFLAFKKSKEMFFALGLFIIFLIPTFSPIPVVSVPVAERYLYLPSILLSMGCAFLFDRFSRKANGTKRYYCAALSLLIFAYGARTFMRNEDWRTPARFLRATLAVSPHIPQVHHGMGRIYLEEGNTSQALEEFRKAAQLDPGNR
jgi:protein O-mannosyl-transferase